MSKLLKKAKKNVYPLSPRLRIAAKCVKMGTRQALNNHHWFSCISFWTWLAQPHSVG